MNASPSQLQDDAALVAEEFRNYAYSVSHDLGAPVRAMVSFSQLLATEHAADLNGEARDYLSIIIENGQKMQRMMDGLLQFSRLNTEAKPPAEADTAKMLDECLTIFHDTIRQTSAVVEAGPLPVVHADIEPLMQLFCILLTNALKFQPRDNIPKIKITAERKNQFWQFSVADNGIGIAPDYRQKIFRLFQRLHTDEEYPGVGIGLAVAQKIARQGGGDLWCESAAGQGSVFHFTIPYDRH